jgi:hypothetical protein
MWDQFLFDVFSDCVVQLQTLFNIVFTADAFALERCLRRTKEVEE